MVYTSCQFTDMLICEHLINTIQKLDPVRSLVIAYNSGTHQVVSR